MPRTRQPAKQRAMVAAATRLQMDDAKLVKAQIGKRAEWQDDAWDFFDLVGEVKQLTWRLGNLIAKLQLYVAVDNPKDPDGPPMSITDEGSGVPPDVIARATAELDRLGTGIGGHSEILRALNMNLEVAAEGFLVGEAAREADPNDDDSRPTPETWTVKSIAEVRAKRQNLPDGRVASVSVFDGPDDRRGKPLDPDLDTSIRFWQQHPRWSSRADCAMRGVLDDCETLVVLKQQLRAEARSHIPAGFLFADSNLSWATEATPTDDEGTTMHPLLRQMVETLNAVIEDPSHAGSLSPMLGLLPIGPGEDIRQKVMHLPLGRTTDTSLDERIHARIEGLARSLNAPPEFMMGHASTTFANADQIDRDTYEDHLQPRSVLIVDILTMGFLRPQLTDEPVEPVGDQGDIPDPLPIESPPSFPQEWVDKLYIWFDPGALIKQPDPEKNADGAHDRGAISDSTYRKVKGYDDGDKPDPVELLIRAALKSGSLSPEVTVALLTLLGVSIDVQPLPGSNTIGQGARRRPLAITASSRPLHGRAAGVRLVNIDRELRTRLLVLADRTMTRALEKAGSVIRAKSAAAVRQRVADVPARSVAAALGCELVAAANVDVDGILEETFATIEDVFRSWGSAAQADALDVVSRVVSGFSTGERDTLKLRQAADLTEAWGWLRDNLTTLAHAKLFDPTALVERLGEFDPNLSVPPGMIRQAISRAGGITGVTTGGKGDAWVSLTDAGTAPAGGIGTGELVMGALEDHGVSPDGGDGYVWDYGPALRVHPYEPHADLDGQTFVNFDDDVLANLEDWPDNEFFFPGDHDGCLCDFVPILGGGTITAPPDESA